MTTEEKIALVKSAWETHGLGSALVAVDLPKSTWYYQQKHRVPYEEKHAHLLSTLEEIARKHPEYGRPRIMAELRDTYSITRSCSGFSRSGSCASCVVFAVQDRVVSVRRSSAAGNGSIWWPSWTKSRFSRSPKAYTDFTELVYANGRRKAQLLPMIGHVSKMAYGWAVSEHADTELALLAWEQAKKTLQQIDVPYAGMIVHHDQDAVFTGYEWARRLVLEDGVRLSFTLRGFKDNPEMESFNSHLKEENHSLFLEAQTLDELIEVVNERMRYYNEERRHSSIGYVPPLGFIERVRSGRER